MDSLSKKLKEHAAAIVIAAIVIIVMILVIIVFTLASAGNPERKLTIADISGSAFILKNDGQVSADKNMNLESGDVLITSADSTVRLTADKDKTIYVEPKTTMYTYYTDKSGKGSIVVNISEGAAVCRIDKTLGKNELFQVKTPNAVITATGTVFRTQFDYYDTYGSYTEAKLTEVQCAQGQVNIQLYDNNAAPADQLMMLTEGKSARLVTGIEAARYLYLNSDTNISEMSEEALKAFIRIAAEREISYSLAELNNAYQAVLGGTPHEETTISTMYPPETPTALPAETQTVSAVPSETVSAVTTAPPETEPPETESSAISVTSPTSMVYTVSHEIEETSPVTTETTVSVTEPETTADTTAPTQTTTSAAPQTAATFTTAPTVTAAPTAPTVTTAPTAPPASTTVSTVPPVVTTASAAPTVTQPPETTVPTAAQTSPVTTVSTSSSPTVLPPPVPTTSSETIPWWEIINSAALTSDQSR